MNRYVAVEVRSGRVIPDSLIVAEGDSLPDVIDHVRVNAKFYDWAVVVVDRVDRTVDHGDWDVTDYAGNAVEAREKTVKTEWFEPTTPPPVKGIGAVHKRVYGE